MLARKVTADQVDLPANLWPGQRDEEAGIAEIAIVFRNFVLEHEVVPEGVVGKLGQEPVVLMSITLHVGQDQRRIEIAFEGLEMVLDLSALEREVPVAASHHLDPPFSDASEDIAPAVTALDLASGRGRR